VGQQCRAGATFGYDEFCARYVAAAEALVTGDPRDEVT
jgi:hypothetical protein